MNQLLVPVLGKVLPNYPYTRNFTLISIFFLIVLMCLCVCVLSRVLSADWGQRDGEGDGGVHSRADLMGSGGNGQRTLGCHSKVQSSLGLPLPRLAKDGGESSEDVQRQQRL